MYCNHISLFPIFHHLPLLVKTNHHLSFLKVVMISYCLWRVVVFPFIWYYCETTLSGMPMLHIRLSRGKIKYKSLQSLKNYNGIFCQNCYRITQDLLAKFTSHNAQKPGSQ